MRREIRAGDEGLALLVAVLVGVQLAALGLGPLGAAGGGGLAGGATLVVLMILRIVGAWSSGG